MVVTWLPLVWALVLVGIMHWRLTSLERRRAPRRKNASNAGAGGTGGSVVAAALPHFTPRIFSAYIEMDAGRSILYIIPSKPEASDSPSSITAALRAALMPAVPSSIPSTFTVPEEFSSLSVVPTVRDASPSLTITWEINTANTSRARYTHMAILSRVHGKTAGDSATQQLRGWDNETVIADIAANRSGSYTITTALEANTVYDIMFKFDVGTNPNGLTPPPEVRRYVTAVTGAAGAADPISTGANHHLQSHKLALDAESFSISVRWDPVHRDDVTLVMVLWGLERAQMTGHAEAPYEGGVCKVGGLQPGMRYHLRVELWGRAATGADLQRKAVILMAATTAGTGVYLLAMQRVLQLTSISCSESEGQMMGVVMTEPAMQSIKGVANVCLITAPGGSTAGAVRLSPQSCSQT